jgi:hypothetical protein
LNFIRKEKMKDKKIKRKIMGVLALFGLLTFGLTSVMDSGIASAGTKSIDKVISANVGSAFSFDVAVSGSDTQDMSLNVDNEWFNTGQYRLTISTNNPTGYSIVASHSDESLTGKGPIASKSIPGVNGSLYKTTGWGLMAGARKGPFNPTIDSAWKKPLGTGGGNLIGNGHEAVFEEIYHVAYGVSGNGPSPLAGGTYRSTATFSAVEQV